MRVRKTVALAIVILLTACAQIRAMSLPKGITFLRGIDPSGLQAPIWSPDGKKIATTYASDSMPDPIAFFGPETRHDVVMIDTATWGLSILASGDGGYLTATTWAYDSKSFAVLWPNGPEGTGLYLFDVDSARANYSSEYGVLSPDLEKIAFFENSMIKIKDIDSQEVKEFEVPFKGYWRIGAWSPDMKKLTLTYDENENARFISIYLLELDSGTFSRFVNDKAYRNYSPIISPNGQLLAYIKSRYIEGDFEDKLLVSRFDQKCEWTIPLDDINSFAWSPDNQKMFLVGWKGVYLADLTVVLGSEFSYGDSCS